MSKHCDQCDYLFINGIGCHEPGCVNANSINCECCNELVLKHNIYHANDWDGLQYCKNCAETIAQAEAEDAFERRNQ